MRKSFAYPYVAWMVIFTVIPLFPLVYYAFVTMDASGVSFTFEHILRVFEPVYLKVLVRSLKIAFISTLLCFLIGYPVAWILADKVYDQKTALLFLFLVPMWMNALLRTYAWMSILGKKGLINSVLQLLGIEPIRMLYTEAAVILGMVYNFLPFMIFPVYTAIKKTDNSLIEAARDLGANPLQIFLKLTFPLSLPGVISGISMVFMPSVTTFIVSDLLGGGKVMLLGNLIERQFKGSVSRNFGSALSLILMVIILISMAVFSFSDKSHKEDGMF